jgi:hypothetical protein
MSLDAMLKKVAEDQCETLWRCDLAAMGEKVFDLDIYRHGVDADREGQGLALRKLYWARRRSWSPKQAGSS